MPSPLSEWSIQKRNPPHGARSGPSATALVHARSRSAAFPLPNVHHGQLDVSLRQVHNVHGRGQRPRGDPMCWDFQIPYPNMVPTDPKVKDGWMFRFSLWKVFLGSLLEGLLV